MIVREAPERHIRLHNFRGSEIRCAGNFFRWENLDDFLKDQEFLYTLRDDVDDALQQEHVHRTFEYDFDANIGWASTVPLGQVDDDLLEPFHLSKTAFGMRVKSAHQNIKAPLTKTVTVTYELKREIDRGSQREQLSVVIFSIYPGEHIGPLRGNMSKPRKDSAGWIFFDWNHPGE